MRTWKGGTVTNISLPFNKVPSVLGIPSGPSRLLAFSACANVSCGQMTGLGSPVVPDMCLTATYQLCSITKMYVGLQDDEELLPHMLETLVQDEWRVTFFNKLLNRRYLEMVWWFYGFENARRCWWNWVRCNDCWALEVIKQGMMRSGTVSR